VQQHILRVVGNVIEFFVANLTYFPVVAEFSKSVLRFDEIIATTA